MGEILKLETLTSPHFINHGGARYCHPSETVGRSSVIGGFAYMDPMQSVDLVQVLSPQVKQ